MQILDEDQIYRRIGEFVVAFQWLENRIREIGWLILDPEREQWPPIRLRKEKTEILIHKVEKLFLKALPKCQLGPELEAEFRTSFQSNVARLHNLRRARNKILHSAYIELKAGDEVHGFLRSDPKLDIDNETGEPLFDQEFLSERSFEKEFRDMAELALFFNRCYIQLIYRPPRREENAPGQSA